MSSTSGPPAEFLQAYKDVYGMARGLTGQPYQSYTGPMVAGFTPDQLSAFGTIQNAQGLAQPYFNQAASYMGASADPISPMGFNVNGGDYSQFLPGVGLDYFTYAGKRSEQAADLAGRAATPIELMQYDIDPYLSPYTENVTNSLATLYNEQNAEQFNAARGNAAAQGAFGGDREAILAAEMARQQKMAQDPTLAQIRQAGFASAQEEFNKQQAVDLQRQMAERQYLLGAAGSTLGSGQLGLGIGQGLWGEFNTQQAHDTAAQQASAYLGAQAGQGLASLGNLAQNSALAGAQVQLGAGNQQQQLAQQLLNVPYYDFMRQQAYPYQQMGWLSNIATGLGGASGGTASTTYPGPSTLGQLGGLASAGVGIYGLGKDQGWWGGGDSSGGGFGDFGGGGELGFPPTPGFAADGGAVPHRAPGGAVGLGVPPEFGGSMVPEGLDSYIPGADGMGAKPANPQGGGLNKMFMQPVTTQTQSGGGGGGILGSILGLATKAIPLLLDDGGAVVPRGTGLARGYDGGGPVRYQARAATPIVADLTHVAAPSSFGPVAAESVRPTMNYAPTFDAQGYPGALVGVPNDWTVPPPLSLPMVNGIMQRPQIGGPTPEMLGVPVPGADTGLATPPSLIDLLSMSDLSQGGASGGHVGLGGIGHFDDGGPVVPVQPPTPDQQLLEKLKRIQELQKIRLEDRWPRFSNMPDAQKRDAGGMIYPDLSQGYIPPVPALTRPPMMGVPKPPSLAQPPQQQRSMSPIADFLKQLSSSGLFGSQGGASLGGAVQPSATPLQYDDGGEVAAPESPTQQRALLQQYANLPMEKLRELAMRYPATTPQGAAIQRALQMKQINPAGAMGSGPAGPYGPAGTVTPGTTAARGGSMGLANGGFSDRGFPWEDYIEPPPPPSRPGDERPKKPPTNGLAEGGAPTFGPDLDNVEIVNVSTPRELRLNGLAPMRAPPPPIPEPTLLPGVMGKETPPPALDLPRPDIGDAGLDSAALAAPPPEAGTFTGVSGPMHYVPDGGGWKAVPGPASTSLAAPPATGAVPTRPGAPARDIDWQTAWPIIKHFESGNRNIMQGVVPAGGGYNPSVGRVTGPSTAQGYGQITNTNWRNLAPKLGIDLAQYPTAMRAPESLQEKVAYQLYLNDKARGGDGFGDWAPYNPKLAAFLGSGKTLPPQDSVVGQGGGEQPIQNAAAPGTVPGQGGLANPPSFSLRTTDDNRTMRDMMSSPWAMLIATGAGMLSSRSPYPGVALGEGLQTGLKMAQTGAAQEGKDEVVDIKRASTEQQARNLAERADLVRKNNESLAASRESQAASRERNLDLKAQGQAQAMEIANMRAAAEMAKAQNAAERARAEQEHKATVAAIKRDEITTYVSDGPDPADPAKRVPGVWMINKAPHKDDPTKGVSFVPGPSRAATGEKAILDDMVAKGIATDIGEAQRKRAEYRRDPKTFEKSHMFESDVGKEHGRLEHAWVQDPTNWGKKKPDLRAQAEKTVRESYSRELPALPGAPAPSVGAAPGAAAAPAAAPAMPAWAAPGSTPYKAPDGKAIFTDGKGWFYADHTPYKAP